MTYVIETTHDNGDVDADTIVGTFDTERAARTWAAEHVPARVTWQVHQIVTPEAAAVDPAWTWWVHGQQVTPC